MVRPAPSMRRITGDVLDSIAFGSLVVAAIALPLVFWPWSTDVFVGPKFGVLRTLTAIGAIASIGYLLVGRGRFRLRLSDWAVIAFLVFNAIAYSLSIDQATSLLGEPLQQLGLATMFAFAGAYAIARISIRTTQRLSIHHHRLSVALIRVRRRNRPNETCPDALPIQPRTIQGGGTGYALPGGPESLQECEQESGSS